MTWFSIRGLLSIHFISYHINRGQGWGQFIETRSFLCLEEISVRVRGVTSIALKTLFSRDVLVTQKF